MQRSIIELYQIFLDYSIKEYKWTITCHGENTPKHMFRTFGVILKYMNPYNTIDNESLINDKEYYMLWEFIEQKFGYGCNIIDILRSENLITNADVNNHLITA